MNKTLWRDALLTVVTLAGLAILQSSASAIYKLPYGHFSAKMIELTTSRAFVFNMDIAGYYERLLNPGIRPTDKRQAKWSGRNRVFDSYRVYRLRPNIENMGEWGTTVVPTNSLGYVGPEWSAQKPLNTRRIALLGDSVTQGVGVNPNQTYGALLESRLNAIGRDRGLSQFEVMNFSVYGYHLTQFLDVAENDVPRFKPDVYVVALTEISVFRSWDVHLVDVIGLGLDPKYEFLRRTVQSSGASINDDDATLHAKLAPFRVAVIRDTLLEMKSNAEQHDAKFIVLLIPGVEDASLTRKKFEGIPELLASLNITSVDLLDTFDGTLNVAPFRMSDLDPHPNALGHAMIAENLYNKLRAQPSVLSAVVGQATDLNRQASASKITLFQRRGARMIGVTPRGAE